MIEILDRNFGGEDLTAIRFGSEKYEIPIHLMQKEREDCILVTDEEIVKYPWLGVAKDTTGQYLLLPKCSIEPIWTIGDKYRSKALEIVRKIALGINQGGKDFAALSVGVMPLYRIYIKDGKDVLILPPDAESILSVSLSRDELDASTKSLLKADTEKGFYLILEMAELLYYGATGSLPFESEEVRRSGYKEIPLEFYASELDEKCSSFISSLLSMGSRKERKIAGNRRSDENLGWFIEETKNLTWNLEDRTREETESNRDRVEKDESFQKLWKEKSHKAKVRRFWIEKGGVILISLLVVLFLSYFVGNWLYETFRAPHTKDLDPKGVILHMLDCQNNLDSAYIDEGFKADPAQYSEVLNLYVTKTTRATYENIDAIVSAPEWVENGMPAILQGTFIYGVIPQSITEIEDGKYEAIIDWYTPFAFTDDVEEENPEMENMARVFVYSVTQDFDFQWNKRGWWVCINNEISDYTLSDVFYVDTYTSTPLLSQN